MVSFVPLVTFWLLSISCLHLGSLYPRIFFLLFLTFHCVYLYLNYFLPLNNELDENWKSQVFKQDKEFWRQKKIPFLRKNVFNCKKKSQTAGFFFSVQDFNFSKDGVNVQTLKYGFWKGQFGFESPNTFL